MQRFIIAICLLATCVLAQERPAGPPSPPRDRPTMDDNDSGEKEEDKEPCPPRTGREWICKIDSWDNNARRVVNSMERQKCDDRDLCYLGPIVSRSLNGPWTRKWMCGPKPCDAQYYVGERPQRDMMQCPRGEECTMGPVDIMINGTVQASARFCQKNPEAMESMEDMEDMMESMWAPPICSVNSSVNGEMMVNKGCEPGEMCMRGPVYTYHEGTQYRLFMCTKTPSMKMPHGGSKAEQMKSKIHMKMMDLADELVMSGYVWNKGPFKTLHKLGDQMKVFFNNVMFLEMQMKEMIEMGEEPKMELPPNVLDFMNKMYISVVMLHNQVVEALGGKGDKIMMGLRNDFNDLSNKYKGTPDFNRMMMYVQENLQWMFKHFRAGDDKSDMAKAAFRNLNEAMMNTYAMVKMMEGDNSRMLKIMEKMGLQMQSVWSIMTGGPVRYSRESLMKGLTDNLKAVQQEAMAEMSPAERIYSIYMIVEKIGEVVKMGRLSMEEGKDLLQKLGGMKLVSLRHYTDSLPNADMLSPIMDDIVHKFYQLWNHMTGGMTDHMSTPESEVYMLKMLLNKLKEPLEEGERMRERGMQPTPNEQRPPSQQGNDDGRRILDEVQDSLSDLGRRLRDDEDDRPMHLGEQAMHNVVDSMRQLHEDLSGMRRIPGGPEQVVRKLSENLGILLRDMEEKGNDISGELGRSFSMVRSGTMDLAEHLRSGRRDYPSRFFGEMIDGMEMIAQHAMRKAREMGKDTAFVERNLQTLRNMRNDGRGDRQPSPSRPNDDMRRQLDDLESTVRELMMNMMNMGDKQDGDRMGDMMDDMMGGMMGDMMGGMMGDMMGGMMGDMMGGMMGDMMGDKMDDKEEPCPKPFWMMQIPQEDKMKWGHFDGAYFGPEMEEPEDSRK